MGPKLALNKRLGGICVCVVSSDEGQRVSCLLCHFAEACWTVVICQDGYLQYFLYTGLLSKNVPILEFECVKPIPPYSSTTFMFNYVTS